MKTNLFSNPCRGALTAVSLAAALAAAGLSTARAGTVLTGTTSANGNFAVLVGGFNNTVNGFASGIITGASNNVTAGNSMIGCGNRNQVLTPADSSAIVSGNDNVVSGVHGVVTGGTFNNSSGFASLIHGNFTQDGGFAGNVLMSDADPGGVRAAAPFVSTEADSMNCLFANGSRFAGLGNSNTDPGAHVLHVQSTQAANSSVLACQVGDATPSAADNMITFFNSTGGAMGAVECTNATTVAYTTTGSDFAEVLAVAPNTEPRQATEIVPVHAGEIGNWAHADHYMVISDQAGFVGNASGQGVEEDGSHHRIAFLGQVPVRVLGAVNAGDYILASEANDGTGIAKSADEVSISEMPRVVGRAWESSSEERIKDVNTAVGLDQTSLVVPALERLERENEALKSRLVKLEQLLERAAE